MKRLFLLVILAGLTLGIFLGIRSSVLKNKEEKPEERVVENTYIDELIMPLIEVDTLNPILTSNKQVADVLKLVYEPLFEFDEKNQLVPALGLNYMEKDEHTWIIQLRENVSWHSEKAFSADDVVFTINTIKSHQQSVYSNHVSNINYAEKLNDNSVAIYLVERDVLFPYRLTFPIIPEYYFRDSMNDAEKSNRPVGTGPYKYYASSDERLILQFNSSWWKDVKAKLNMIYFNKYNSYGEAIKAFKSSEIDLITTSMETWEKKFGVIGINHYRYENEKFDVLIPNCERIVLSDSSVRRAILYAINRENIIDSIYENNAIKHDTMAYSHSWTDNNQEIEFNPDKAKQLLTNSSWQFRNNTWTKTINGKSYSLRLNLMVTKEKEDKLKVANALKENLESIGIKVNIVQVDNSTFLKNIESKNFELALGTIETKNEFDVIDLLKNKNYAHYNATPLDEKINQLYISNLNLKDAFLDFQNAYKNELPYIGLWYKTNTLLTNKAVKGNITPTLWNPYHHIYTWSK